MKTRTRLTEAQIDEEIIKQADDEKAWEKPIRVRRKKALKLPLTSDLAARVAFFARLHRETSVEQWLYRVIRERLELEEAAFANVKRELTSKNGG